MRRILLGLLVVAATTPGPRAQAPAATPALRSGTIPIITVDGARFRDLNRNGRLDPYEDWRRDIDARVADLLGRMSLEEKAGTMMHGTAPSTAPGIGLGAAYDTTAAERLILGAHVTSLITRLSAAPEPKTLLARLSQSRTSAGSSRSTPIWRSLESLLMMKTRSA